MTALSDQDLNNIKDLHRRWIAKELEGNEAGVVALCTADVQWLGPGAPPVVGKEEIAKYLTTHHVKLETIDVTDPSIEGSGTIAYLTSNYRTRYKAEIFQKCRKRKVLICGYCARKVTTGALQLSRGIRGSELASRNHDLRYFLHEFSSGETMIPLKIV